MAVFRAVLLVGAVENAVAILMFRRHRRRRSGGDPQEGTTTNHRGAVPRSRIGGVARKTTLDNHHSDTATLLVMERGEATATTLVMSGSHSYVQYVRARVRRGPAKNSQDTFGSPRFYSISLVDVGVP